MGRTTKSRSPRVEALKVEGLQATVQVRRHPTARRMTLRVSRTKHAVLMTVPLQCSLADAGNFLHTHLDWVRQHLGAVPAPISLDGGEILHLAGSAEHHAGGGDLPPRPGGAVPCPDQQPRAREVERDEVQLGVGRDAHQRE